MRPEFPEITRRTGLNKLSQRPIDSVFKEIEANTPEEVPIAKVKPDRRELGEILMSEIL